MHDGSIGNLSDVVEHYASGGKKSAGKDDRIKQRSLTTQNKTDLVEFLKALTDPEVLTDQRLSDPWEPAQQ